MSRNCTIHHLCVRFSKSLEKTDFHKDFSLRVAPVFVWHTDMTIGLDRWCLKYHSMLYVDNVIDNIHNNMCVRCLFLVTVYVISSYKLKLRNNKICLSLCVGKNPT